MSDLAEWSVHGGVAVLTLNNPPVNAISQRVRAAIVANVKRANREADIGALVIRCAGRTFFAGADLKEFGKPSTKPFLTEVVDAIETSQKPVVAAIHGSALGGGLEIAMACHYRIALPDARLGLPEVKLGLMPGARGTQLLPRLVGVEAALEMIALGDPVSAKDEKKAGLLDEIADGDLLTEALLLAEQIADRPLVRTRDKSAPRVDDAVYAGFLKKHARKFRGLDAPPAIIESVRAASELPFDDGAKREREIFLKLREGPQNEALRYAFFAEREAAKFPDADGVRPRSVDSVGVIGSGTMGAGIAIAFLTAGMPVVLYEKNADALERGAAHIRKTLARNVEAGRMAAAEAEAAAGIFAPALDMNALSGADLVVEAAYEDIRVKHDIFGKLDRIAKPGAVLATNTSYLDVDAIASATARPADVVGMHFFSPANVMKLLEVVRGKCTATDVIATAFAIAKRLGKVPVLSGNAYGFIGNRMLAVRRKHAEAMVVEGAPPSQIDRVLEDFGFAMGPMRVSDLAGLDLGWSPENSSGATLRERLCESGRRGQKSGGGFYDYDENRNPTPSRAAEEIIRRFAHDNGVVQRSFSDEEIFNRLTWPMVDEGAKLLSEGIAARESDIDVVWLNGYGWPSWTGGPMFYARRIGLTEVRRRLEALGLSPSDEFAALT